MDDSFDIDEYDLEKYDYLIRLMLIGDQSVGKTSFLNRYFWQSFSSDYVPTRGLSRLSVNMRLMLCDDKRIQLHPADVTGDRRDLSLVKAYFFESMGFIIMYDATNIRSFAAVTEWYDEVKSHGSSDPYMVLVGNKSECDEQRVISVEQGQNLADRLGIKFFEISVKDNVNVDSVLDHVVNVLFERAEQSPGDSEVDGYRYLHYIDYVREQADLDKRYWYWLPLDVAMVERVYRFFLQRYGQQSDDDVSVEAQQKDASSQSDTDFPGPDGLSLEKRRALLSLTDEEVAEYAAWRKAKSNTVNQNN